MTSIDRAGELLPAADTFRTQLQGCRASSARPFGLLYAVTPATEGPFDPADLVFDSDSQIVVAIEGADWLRQR